MKTDHRQNLESKLAVIIDKTAAADDLLRRLLVTNLITSLLSGILPGRETA